MELPARVDYPVIAVGDRGRWCRSRNLYFLQVRFITPSTHTDDAARFDGVAFGQAHDQGVTCEFATQ